jgi:putative ABC transport system permease protein
MFIALRDLTFAKGRFLLMATVVALIAFLLTILSGLSTGLIRNNISALMALDISHIAFEYNDKPSYRNSMVDREMWEGWREHPWVIDTQPLGHTMFNARTKDDLPLNEVVLWGIEPGSFLEPAVNRGEQLGRLENGVVIASKLVEKGIDIGDVLILDRVLTELEVIGVTDEHYIGHVPVIYTLLPKWQEATYGPPGGPPPGEKLPSILFDYASVIALQIKPDTLPGELQTTDEDLGTITIDKTAAYEASTGYVEEVRTVQMIQAFLFVISAVVMGAFFSVWTLQRTKEIGLVKALGASNIYLLKDSLGQVLLLMIGATVIGTLGAIQVGRLMEGSGFPYLLVPETVMASAVMLIIAGLFGSALSLRLIMKIDPIVALGREQ